MRPENRAITTASSTAASLRAIENLTAAATETGTGGGGGANYLRVADDGTLRYGQEQAKLAPDHRFAVHIQGFAHGYVDADHTNKIRDRRVVPMAVHPTRPVPPGGSSMKLPDGTYRTLGPGEYGTYEGGGPREVTEIMMSSVTEPGFSLVFTAWGISAANRIRSLLDRVILQAQTEEGKAGYLHPVIIPKVGSYENKKFRKTIRHFDFDLVDWLHDDGNTLLSASGGLPQKIGPATAQKSTEATPWDDVDLDDLTEEEREFVNSAA